MEDWARAQTCAQSDGGPDGAWVTVIYTERKVTSVTRATGTGEQVGRSHPDCWRTSFAVAGGTKSSRDLVMNHCQTFGREPFGYAIGPIKDRGDPTGIVVHQGYMIAYRT